MMNRKHKETIWTKKYQIGDHYQTIPKTVIQLVCIGVIVVGGGSLIGYTSHRMLQPECRVSFAKNSDLHPHYVQSKPCTNVCPRHCKDRGGI